MLRNNGEIIISIILIILLALFLDPFMLLMPSVVVFCLMAASLLLFGFFAAFVWRESARDEREQLHKMIAGRIGFVAGAAVLLVGIMYQTIATHSVEPWLIAALAAMVLGKLGGLLYSRSKM